MKNLQESLEGLNQHYLELLKNLNRVLDVNIEMLYKQKLDSALYGFEVKLKEDSIISIARFQPAAGNLRLLIMLINSARLLERMGDLLKANFKIIKDIEKSSPQVSKYLKETLYPMVLKIKNSNEKALYLLLTQDEEIDEMAEKNMTTLIDLMKASPDNVEGGTYLVLLNKKYERFSDHVMHLAVDLVYILKGENLRKLELLEEKKIKK